MNDQTAIMLDEREPGVYYWMDHPDRKPLSEKDIKALELLDPNLIVITFVIPRPKNQPLTT